MQVYLTMFGGGLGKSLNSGNVSILEDPDILVSNILSQLMSFLRSHQELQLSTTLRLDVRVLSIDFVKKKLSESGSFKLHTPAMVHGSNKAKNFTFKGNPHSRRQDIFSIPTGFPGSPNAFANACLLVCVALGMIQRAYLKDPMSPQGQKWRVTCGLHSGNQTTAKRAGKAILKEICQIMVKTGLTMGPHQLSHAVPKICEAYNIQLVVFSRRGRRRIVFMWPQTFDPELCPIYLHQPLTDAKSNVAHLELVSSLSSYSIKNGFTCPFCNKTVHSRFLEHLCTKAKACPVCRRIFLRSNMYIDEALKRMYCDGEMFPDTQYCQKCKKGPRNSACMEHHAKYFCVAAGKCQNVCMQRVTKGQYESIETALEHHQCGEKVCKYCSARFVDNVDNEHWCPMKEVTLPTHWNNLAFLHFSYQPVALSDFEITFKEILCSLCFEEGRKEHFRMKTFQIPQLGHWKNVRPENIHMPYYLEACLKQQSRELHRHFIRMPFGEHPRQSERERVKGLAAQQTNNEVLSSLIEFIVSEQFIGFSIIVPDQCSMV